MRRFALALLLAAASPVLMGAAPAHPPVLSAADGAELDAISAYLNGIVTLKGGFLQIGPSGTADEGTFYISKPGKMRFEYNPPSPVLIVSDGRVVGVVNKRLATVDRYFLSDTPLGLVLGNRIDLRRDPQLVSVTHQQGAILINLHTVNNRAKADITMVFSEPEYELRQWTVIDNQGLSTTVALRALLPGAAMAPALFVVPDKNALAHMDQH